MNFRIGFGYDVHKLVPERKLILGGVEIPFERGLLGHSDADVLIHSIIDAILGTIAFGDIGALFPDNDVNFKDIDSRILLRKTMEVLHDKGFKIGNIDSTICAQKPKLRKYILMMRNNLAEDLKTDLENVSVKATTEEKMGISGSEEGMTAYSVVLVEKING